jgi:hypothetical protein
VSVSQRTAEIVAAVNTGESQASVAKRYCVSKQRVSEIIARSKLPPKTGPRKSQLAELALLANPARSNRVISRELMMSVTLVGNVRKKLEASGRLLPDERIKRYRHGQSSREIWNHLAVEMRGIRGGLSGRAYNALRNLHGELKASDAWPVGEPPPVEWVAKLSPKDILSLPKVGRGTLREIQAWVAGGGVIIEDLPRNERFHGHRSRVVEQGKSTKE